jgi:hypothetical protein
MTRYVTYVQVWADKPEMGIFPGILLPVVRQLSDGTTIVRCENGKECAIDRSLISNAHKIDEDYTPEPEPIDWADLAAGGWTHET